MTTVDESVLDEPARAALSGPHAHFVERRGRVVRYPVDVAPFLALDPATTGSAWVDLAALARGFDLALGTGPRSDLSRAETPSREFPQSVLATRD
ncbi:hypothetical protein [Amycolatopsis sp. NPDC051903]|uniref:hypothetical protein n=1 Tax=Amycolatopsis sp. NPDC051903 TaxID=3363936 RepID=UPI003795DF3E